MTYKMIPIAEYWNLVTQGLIPHKRNSLVLLEDGTELMVYGVTLDAGGYVFDHHRGGPVGKEITHVLVKEIFRYVWLNIIDGTFSNSWSEEDHKELYKKIDVPTEWKLIKYSCLTDEAFNFYNKMQLK